MNMCSTETISQCCQMGPLSLLLSLLAALTVCATSGSRVCQADDGASPRATSAQQASSSLQPGDVADLVLRGGHVWTGTPGDDGKTATAVAVYRTRIMAVGSDADVQPLIGPSTRVVELKGRRLIPSFTDSHTHVIGGGLLLGRLQLRDVKDRASFVAAIGEAAKTKRTGEWVLGGRWSTESWPDPTQPDKSWIDPVTGETPVLLMRMDGHQALVNSVALRLAGIDASGPPDPAGGEIERDPKTGEPLGILKESAIDLVSKHVPPTSPAERLDALERAIRHAHALGVTAMHDMSAPEDVPVFFEADRGGQLKLRLYVFVHEDDWNDARDRVRELTHESTDHVHVLGFKGFMDGSLGSRTAYMRQAYKDAAKEERYPRGQLSAQAENIARFQASAVRAHQARLQLAVHAIGDEANHILLDTYEKLGPAAATRARRHRIEHAQHLLVEDIPRLAKFGVVASMQPLHKADDGRYAEKALTKEQLAGSYAYRQLVDAGALVVFGSDWPVVSLNPIEGIDAAVNAKTLVGDVWLPEHSLTVEEALRAYTAAPPLAVHDERSTGTIKAGKHADLVVLSEDLLTMPAARIGDVRVDMTIFAGEVVYRRAE
jgi:predicted amidohydrolase YtcJ